MFNASFFRPGIVNIGTKGAVSTLCIRIVFLEVLEHFRICKRASPGTRSARPKYVKFQRCAARSLALQNGPKAFLGFLGQRLKSRPSELQRRYRRIQMGEIVSGYLISDVDDCDLN